MRLQYTNKVQKNIYTLRSRKGMIGKSPKEIQDWHVVPNHTTIIIHVEKYWSVNTLTNESRKSTK